MVVKMPKSKDKHRNSFGFNETKELYNKQEKFRKRRKVMNKKYGLVKCPEHNKKATILSDFGCWRFYCAEKDCDYSSQWFGNIVNPDKVKPKQVNWECNKEDENNE